MALLEAQTKHGRVKGYPTTYQASTIFKGIPYAKPPVGDLRWRAPQSCDDWSEPFDAIIYGSIPLQMRPAESDFYRHEFYPIEWPSSEDCLYINVITPAETPDEKLPVALWVYGGGFVQGYSQKLETDGEAFAKRGVIYVSFNYRVGIFGYASCEALDAETEEGLSGNYGLMDQIAALRWVHENIAAFGGDPNKVTIFGQSAGAMSVYDLLCSPQSKNLIAGAIMESGGGPVFNMVNDDSTRSYCSKFFEWLGKTPEEARAIEGKELFSRWLDFMAEYPPEKLPLNPVNHTTTLPGEYLDPFKNRTYADVPCIIGSTAEEDRSYGIEGVTDMRDQFLGGALALCEKQASEGKAPIYMYHLTNATPGEPCRGAYHSSEHFYIFQTYVRSKRPFSGKDADLSNAMCDYWTNFVKTGNPNGEGLPTWEAYTSGCERAIRFDREVTPQMIDIPAYNGESRKAAKEALEA